MEVLREKNLVLLDIEFIQSTKDHKFIVNYTYILSNDGFTGLKLDFFPCMAFKDLDRNYEKILSCSSYS